MPSELVLVIGGARSGKSLYAEQMIRHHSPPWHYIATADSGYFDEEMTARIAAHRARRDNGWQTSEAPISLSDAVRGVPRSEPIMIDCLTLWISNLLLAGYTVEPALSSLLVACDQREAPTICVSNEVGMGVVPENALARHFRDAQGLVNQTVAARADRVFFMVAGIAQRIK